MTGFFESIHDEKPNRILVFQKGFPRPAGRGQPTRLERARVSDPGPILTFMRIFIWGAAFLDVVLTMLPVHLQ